MVLFLMPPSTWMSTSSPKSVRALSIFLSIAGMNACPPKPGSTVRVRTRSMYSVTGSRTATSVAGVTETPACMPASCISLQMM